VPAPSEAVAARHDAHAAGTAARLVNLGAVLVPIGALVAAIVLSWGSAFDWVQFWIMVGMAVATSFGVTIGFHRLVTHRAFGAPAPVRYIFAVLGSMAVEGPVIRWAATHRLHHQHSDDHLDPHSPHTDTRGARGPGVLATLRGVFHAHVGWLFDPPIQGLDRYDKDLRADPVLCAVDRQFVLWVAAGLLLPALLGGLITLSFTGALLGFLWGGLVRVLFVHHTTWSVNSVCHLWGFRPFDCGDHSRNNPIVGVLGLGEGWHNNHHAFPTSARHGLRWWELDLSYLLIRAMSLVGLAREIRIPPRERVAAKRRRGRRRGSRRASTQTFAEPQVRRPFDVHFE
jgi:stearoyl-CoA desaturase (Delta-9 desaturase)